MNKIGQFKCCECYHEFETTIGPHIQCPKCGSIYAEWINYEEMKKRNFK